MTLIILLAALYAQWFLGQRFSLSDYDWFTPYVAFLNEKLSSANVMEGYVGLAVIVLPVVFAVLILNLLFDDWAFHIFELVFGFVVFFYCLNAVNYEEALEHFFKGNKAEKEVKAFVDAALPKTDGGIARKVTNTIFVRSLNDIFSTIFWFVLLGPSGVAVYFMVSLVGQGSIKETKPVSDAARMVQAVMDWVPVRLVGLSFALMGSFHSVFVYWVKHIVTGLDSAQDLITHYGLLALDANPRESKEATHKESSASAQLVFRSIFVWLVFIAVITFASLF